MSGGPWPPRFLSTTPPTFTNYRFARLSASLDRGSTALNPLASGLGTLSTVPEFHGSQEALGSGDPLTHDPLPDPQHTVPEPTDQ